MGKCENDDCGCQKGLATPAPCPPSTPCGEYQPCVNYVNAQCVQYTGEDIFCNEEVVVEQGAMLADFLPNIVERICNPSSDTILEARVEISSAEIRTANSSAILVLPAPGVGKFIEIQNVYQKYDFLTLPYKGAGNTNLRYVDEASDIAFYIGGDLDAATGDYFIRGQHYNNESISINKGIEWFTQGDSVDGLGTIVLNIRYKIIELV
jgi:hypothetical protein